MTRFAPRPPPEDETGEAGDNQTPISSIEDLPDPGNRRSEESQDTLRNELGNLRFSSQTPRRSSRNLLSPDEPRQSIEEGPLLTVRDLANATPSPSPSPEPVGRSCTANANRGPTIESVFGNTSALDASGRGEETLGLDDLNLEDEDNFVQYNVNEEPLPPTPFSKRNYQNALKAGKALASNVSNSLSRCDSAKDTTTQLYKLKCRAEVLRKFDNPMSRRIGIVGDSAAGIYMKSSGLTWQLMCKFKGKVA